MTMKPRKQIEAEFMEKMRLAFEEMRLDLKKNGHRVLND